MFSNKLNKISLINLMWILPLLASLHNLEELMTMGAFWRDNLWIQSLPFYNLIQSTDLQFAVSVTILTIIVVLITYFAVKNPQKGKLMDLFVLILLLIFVNAFIHLIQALLFISYVPGLITGLLLIVPYSLILICRIFQEELINKAGFILMLLLALILQIPLIITALWIGKMLIPA
jgi:hypothetical protein